MENKEDILKRLVSEDAALQLEAVNEMKAARDMSVVPELLNLLSPEKGHQTITALINLLADIKENSFREILIARIRATPDSATRALLLRICWESSLDYSDYAGLFADILINDDFTTALEAATVIEETFHNLTDEQRESLHRSLQSLPAEKQFLIENLNISESSL